MSSITPFKLLKVIPLLLLIVVIPLLKTTANLDEGLLIRFIGLILLTLFLLTVARIKKTNTIHYYRHPLVIIYFLFCLFTGFRLLWGNTYGDTIFDWIKISSYFILTMVLIQTYSYETLRSKIPLLISILGFIISIIGLYELLIQMQNGLLQIPLSTYQIKSVFGHRNLFAQILFLCLPFQIYCVVSERSRIMKFLFSFAMIINIFLIIVISNRATWLALILGFITIGVLEYIRYRITKLTILHNANSLKFVLISLLIGISVAFIFFSYYTHSSDAQNHLNEIAELDIGSGKDRIELWKRTISIIKEYPVAGCGGANWKIEVLRYGNEGLVSEDNITFYQRPHNDFLWITSEYGVIGGMLYLLIFMFAIYLLVKRVLSRNVKNILFSYALLFGLIGFVVFSFFSFPHERVVQNIFLSIFLASIILGNSNSKKEKTIIKKWLIGTILLIGFLIAISSLFIGFSRLLSEKHLKKALQAKSMNNHSLVISEIENGMNSLYSIDPTSTPLSWYQGLAWYQLGNIDSALIFFTKAYEMVPSHVHVLNNLATAYSQKGRNEDAIFFFKKAISVYPKFDDASLNLCAVYYNMGKLDNAYSTLKKIDVNSKHPKYKKYLVAVLKPLITNLLVDSGNTELIKKLPDDEEWYIRIHNLSKSFNTPLKDIIFENNAFTNLNNL